MYAAPEVLMGQPSNEKVRAGSCLVHGPVPACNGAERARTTDLHPSALRA